MRNDNPDQPPDGAVPLAIARRILCGDTRMVRTFEALERQLAEVLPDIVAGDRKAVRWSGPIRRDLITTRDWIDQKLLGRLRIGELVAWGRSEAAGWRWVRIPAWLWDRIAVLDWELGEVGREMPTGIPTHAYYEVRVLSGDEPANAGTPHQVAEVSAPPPVGTIGTEKRCQTWLLHLMADGSSPEWPRQKYHDLVVERFGSGLSGRGFLRAWANARALSENAKWGEPGRPRKSKP